MTTIRLYASHPDYQKFAFMQNLLLMAINPHMFFDVELDIPEAERLATVELIKADMGRYMDDYEYLPASIAEAINRMEE